MKRFAALRWPRLLTGVFLALLVREAVAPAPANASCGDYVTVTNPSGQHSSPSAPQTSPVRTTPCSRHLPHDPLSPGELPCRAPSCSGGPALPAPPVSTSSPGGPERWDCLLSPPAVVAAGAFALP